MTRESRESVFDFPIIKHHLATKTNLQRHKLGSKCHDDQVHPHFLLSSMVIDNSTSCKSVSHPKSCSSFDEGYNEMEKGISTS
jgi:hypothetical protein